MPESPVVFNKPTPWDVVAASNSWKEGSPENKLALLVTWGVAYEGYLRSIGSSPEQARAARLQHFQDWRGNALDNGVLVGEHLKASVSNTAVDIVSKSLKGAGLQIQGGLETPVEREDRINKQRVLTKQQQDLIKARYSALPEDQRESFVSTFAELHDIYIDKDENGQLDVGYNTYFDPELTEAMNKIWVVGVPKALGSALAPPLIEAGNKLNEARNARINQKFKENPQLAETFFMGDLPKALTSGVVNVGVGRILGSGGLAFMGSAMGTAEGTQVGQDVGMSPEEINNLAGLRSAIGTLEFLGVGGTQLKLIEKTPLGREAIRLANKTIFQVPGAAATATFVGGGIKEGLQENVSGLLVDFTEKATGVWAKQDDQARAKGLEPIAKKIFDADRRSREFAAGFITGGLLDSVGGAQKQAIVAGQFSINRMTQEVAQQVIDGQHSAIQEIDKVLAQNPTEEVRSMLTARKAEFQERAKAVLDFVLERDAELRQAVQDAGMVEPEQQETSAVEKLLGADQITQLRNMSEEEYTSTWNQLSRAERSQIRKALGVEQKAGITKVRKALLAQTETVAPAVIDESTATVQEMIAWMEAVDAKRGQAPDRVTVVQTAAELDALMPAPTEQAVDAATAAANINAGEAASSPGVETLREDYEVLGANSVDYASQSKQASIAVVTGTRTPQTLVREKSQVWFKRALDSKEVTVEELLAEKRKLEAGLPEDQRMPDTLEGVIEWASDLSVDYIVVRAPSSTLLPAKVQSWFTRLKTWVSDVMRRAVRLQKQLDNQTVSPRFEGMLAQATGLQVGKSFNPTEGLSPQETLMFSRMQGLSGKSLDQFVTDNDPSDAVINALETAKRRSQQTPPVIQLPPSSAPQTGTTLTLARKARRPTRLTQEALKEAVDLANQIANQARPDLQRSNRIKMPMADAQVIAQGSNAAGVTELISKYNLSPDQVTSVKQAFDAWAATPGKKAFDSDGNLTAKALRENLSVNLSQATNSAYAQRLNQMRHVQDLERLIEILPPELKASVIRTTKFPVDPSATPKNPTVGFGQLLREASVNQRSKLIQQRAERVQQVLEKHVVNVLKGDLDKLFAVAKPKKNAKGVRKGPGAELVDIIEEVKKISELNPETATAEIDRLRQEELNLPEGDEKADNLERQKLVTAFADLRNRNSGDLFQAVELLKELISEGRLAQTQADLSDAARRAEMLEKGLNSVRGGNAPLNSAQRKNNALSISTYLESVQDFFLKVTMTFDAMLNLASRLDPSAVGFKGYLNKIFAAKENQAFRNREKYAQEKFVSLLRVIAEISGIDLNSRRFVRDTELSLLDHFQPEERATVLRKEPGQQHRFKQTVSIEEARQAIDLGATLLTKDGKAFSKGQMQVVFEALEDYETEVAALESLVKSEEAELTSLHEALIRRLNSLNSEEFDAEFAALKPVDQKRVKQLLNLNINDSGLVVRQAMQNSSIVRSGPVMDDAGLETLSSLREFISAKNQEKVRLKQKKNLQDLDLTDWDAIQEVAQVMSQDDLIKITMLARQPDQRRNLEYWGWTEEVIAEAEKLLTPRSIAIREHLAAEYESAYSDVNEVFRRMNGTNLTKFVNYSPAQKITAASLLDVTENGNRTSSSVVSYGFLSDRVQNLAEPDLTNGAMAEYMAHMSEAAHYIYYAELVRDMNSVFGNKDMQQALTESGGDNLRRLINRKLHAIATDGQVNAFNSKFVDTIKRNFVLTGLAGNIAQIAKQLSGNPAYLFDVPTAAFTRYEAEFGAELVRISTGGEMSPQVRKFLECDFVQSRFKQGQSKQLQTILSGKYNKKKGKLVARDSAEYVIEASMFPSSWGDMAVVMSGGYAVYMNGRQEYLNQAKANGKDITSQEVIDEADAAGEDALAEITSRTQTGEGPANKTDLELSGSLGGLFNVFMTNSRNLYLSTYAVNPFDGRPGAFKEGMKRLIVGHVLVPVTFQAFSDLFKYGSLDDEEKEEFREDSLTRYAFAMLLGPLNGIPFLGEAFGAIIRFGFGVKGYESRNPITQAALEMGEPLKVVIRNLKDNEKNFVQEVSDFTLASLEGIAAIKGGRSLVVPISQRSLRSMGLDDDVRNLLENPDQREVRLNKEKFTKAQFEIRNLTGNAKVEKVNEMVKQGLISADQGKTLKDRLTKAELEIREKSRTPEVRRLLTKSSTDGTRAIVMGQLLENLTPEQRRAKMAEWRKVDGLLTRTVVARIPEELRGM